jgi:hypothetical protein
MPSSDSRDMSSAKGLDTVLGRDPQVTGALEENRLPADSPAGGTRPLWAGECAHVLRVKPDRRRVRAAYPPHLDRRRRRS